jgi:hypothetical protein
LKKLKSEWKSAKFAFFRFHFAFIAQALAEQALLRQSP